MYSIIGSLLSFTVHPFADLSADASANSKACSTFKSGSPSISKMRPLKIFFLFCFATVRSPFLIAT